MAIYRAKGAANADAGVDAGQSVAVGDPILLLDGAPGVSSIANAVYWGGWDPDQPLAALLAKHDLVAIDLRGTGGSRPSLSCVDGLEPVPIGGPPSPQLPATELEECHRTLQATGAGLSAYGTLAAAIDVELVAQALGLTRFGVLGVAHGARVALELVRRRSTGLTAVVLDSAVPPTVASLPAEGAMLARAVDAALRACETKPACQMLAPDARRAIPEIVTRLDEAPVDVFTHGGAVNLTGLTFLQSVSMALAQSDPSFAQHVQAAAGGDYAFFAAILGAPHGSGALGAHLGVVCAEEMSRTTDVGIEAAADAVPMPFARGLLARFYARACPGWGVPPAAPTLPTPVTTDLPLLLLTGQIDPLVSPEWARAIAATAPAARAVELVGEGHSVVHRICGATAATRFLDDPATFAPPACAGGSPD